jgi:hypothetical protein
MPFVVCPEGAATKPLALLSKDRQLAVGARDSAPHALRLRARSAEKLHAFSVALKPPEAHASIRWRKR